MFELLKMKKIKKMVLAGGGATLKAGSLKKADFKKGYMVSLAGSEYKCSINDLKIKVLKKYNNLAKKCGGFVGFWLDDNTLYIDISKHFISKEKAYKEAVKNNQLALYDIYNNKSVYIKDILINYKRVLVKKYSF